VRGTSGISAGKIRAAQICVITAFDRTGSTHASFSEILRPSKSETHSFHISTRASHNTPHTFSFLQPPITFPRRYTGPTPVTTAQRTSKQDSKHEETHGSSNSSSNSSRIIMSSPNQNEESRTPDFAAGGAGATVAINTTAGAASSAHCPGGPSLPHDVIAGGMAATPAPLLVSPQSGLGHHKAWAAGGGLGLGPGAGLTGGYCGGGAPAVQEAEPFSQSWNDCLLQGPIATNQHDLPSLLGIDGEGNSGGGGGGSHGTAVMTSGSSSSSLASYASSSYPGMELGWAQQQQQQQQQGFYEALAAAGGAGAPFFALPPAATASHDASLAAAAAAQGKLLQQGGVAADGGVSAARNFLLQQQQQQQLLQTQLLQKQLLQKQQEQQFLQLRSQQQQVKGQQQEQLQQQLQHPQQQHVAAWEDRESAGEDGTSSWNSGNSIDDPPEVDNKVLTPEERLERNRIRNRDHSRRSRQRKKALVEGMKNQASTCRALFLLRGWVTELGAYRMLVEQAHDLISAHTTDDRTVFLYASNAFQRVLGISTEDLLGIQLIHLVHPDDAGRVTEALRRALLCNQVTQVVVYRLRHQQQEFTVESSFRVVPTKLVAITRVGGPGVAILP
ncbi:unnamed protein product, partial [Ectocarpus sp. 4 AP-2014]